MTSQQATRPFTRGLGELGTPWPPGSGSPSPLGVEAPARPARLATSPRKVEQWWAGVWEASIDWWAAVLTGPRDEEVVLDFDEAAEMVGPATHPLPVSGLSISAVSALVHEHEHALIPREHVVARVVGDRLLISLVGMLGVQPTLPGGVYRGEALLGSGLAVPVRAVKRL